MCRVAAARLTFYFDPVCPWTWNTSRWLVDIAEHLGLAVDWRPLSLAVLNAGREVPDEYLALMEVGHAARGRSAPSTPRLGAASSTIGSGRRWR